MEAIRVKRAPHFPRGHCDAHRRTQKRGQRHDPLVSSELERLGTLPHCITCEEWAERVKFLSLSSAMAWVQFCVPAFGGLPWTSPLRRRVVHGDYSRNVHTIASGAAVARGGGRGRPRQPHCSRSTGPCHAGSATGRGRRSTRLFSRAGGGRGGAARAAGGTRTGAAARAAVAAAGRRPTACQGGRSSPTAAPRRRGVCPHHEWHLLQRQHGGRAGDERRRVQERRSGSPTLWLRTVTSQTTRLLR